MMYENKMAPQVCCASLKDTSFHGLTISVARWKKTEKYTPLATKSLTVLQLFLPVRVACSFAYNCKGVPVNSTLHFCLSLHFLCNHIL